METTPRIWNETYRPTRVDQCILPKQVSSVAEKIIHAGTIPNMLLHGPPGTGKTAIAGAMCQQLDYEVLFINGSDEGRLLDTLRTKIRDFAASMSLTGQNKAIIIDEADYLTADTVQPALRSFMEQYAVNCAFILTANVPNRIIDALHSRCTVVPFKIAKNDRANIAKGQLQRAARILDNESIDYDKATLKEVIKKHFPDFRRAINELQVYAKSGTIDSGILGRDGSTDIERIIEFLKNKNFGEMRQWLATTAGIDMPLLCRNLYDSMYDYVKSDSIPELVVILADYQYKNAFVADEEINMAAMLTQIMTDVEFVQ